MQGPPVSAEGIERADPERPEIKRKAGLQAQFRECAQRLGLTRADEHRRDRRRLPLLELILDSLSCPDQRDRFDQFVGNRSRGLVLLSREIKVLKLRREVFVTEIPDVAVIEILVAGAHAADIKREVRLYRCAALFEVGAHHARYVWREVEILEALAAARLAKTLFEMRLIKLVVPRRAHPDR